MTLIYTCRPRVCCKRETNIYICMKWGIYAWRAWILGYIYKHTVHKKETKRRLNQNEFRVWENPWQTLAQGASSGRPSVLQKLLWQRENTKNTPKQKKHKKDNEEKHCPLVLKENAAGILSVVNATAVQLKSFCTAQMKQLSTQFFSARGQPLVPLRPRHLFPPTAPVTSDPSGLSVLCIYAQS